MRAMVRTFSTVVALMVLMCVAGEAQVSLRPGLYERVMDVDVAGSTGQNKDTICMTPEEAKDVVKTIAMAGKETDCKVSDVKTAPGGKLTFNVSCKADGGRVTTRGQRRNVWPRLVHQRVEREVRGRSDLAEDQRQAHWRVQEVGPAVGELLIL